MKVPRSPNTEFSPASFSPTSFPPASLSRISEASLTLADNTRRSSRRQSAEGVEALEANTTRRSRISLSGQVINPLSYGEEYLADESAGEAATDDVPKPHRKPKNGNGGRRNGVEHGTHSTDPKRKQRNSRALPNGQTPRPQQESAGTSRQSRRESQGGEREGYIPMETMNPRPSDRRAHTNREPRGQQSTAPDASCCDCGCCGWRDLVFCGRCCE